VFCASLCDVFENWDGPIVNHGGHKLYRDRKSLLGEAIRTAHECLIDAPYIEPLTLDDLRRDLFGLIDQTPHLDWQLLTKRPENVRRMWRVDGNGKDPGASNYLLRDNVWLGTSVSDQQTADKMIPDLLKCRDLVSKLFVSVEPLLGPVDLANLNDPEGWSIDPLRGIWQREYGPTFDEPGNVEGYGDGPTLDWVIVGGESGNQARRCDVGWIRDIVVQCKAAGVPCFVKQLGAFVVDSRADGGIHSQIRDEECWPDLTVDRLMPDNDPALMDGRVLLTHPKGGDPAEWPEDLRVREFPDG
jgi:protein gp37